MDGAAPGRAASGRGVPIELSPTAGRAPRDPRPQGRAQGHPKPVRGAARRPVPRPARPTPNRNGSSNDYDRRTADEPRGTATVAEGRARRPYGAPPRYTRRAATAARAGSIFWADTIWDAGRHYEEGDDVRA